VESNVGLIGMPDRREKDCTRQYSFVAFFNHKLEHGLKNDFTGGGGTPITNNFLAIGHLPEKKKPKAKTDTSRGERD